MKTLLQSFTKSGVAIITFRMILLSAPQIFAHGAQTFNPTGTFNLPIGVTSIKVEAWGGAAGGNATGNGGGGGGAYFSANTFVNPNSPTPW